MIAASFAPTQKESAITPLLLDRPPPEVADMTQNGWGNHLELVIC